MISRPAAVLLAPVLIRQGGWLRTNVRLCPEPPGVRAGVEPADATPDLRLLVFGESTAAAAGAAHQHEGLAPLLAAELAERNQQAVAWSVVARTGATAGYAIRKLLPVAPGGQNLIIVVLGVNDALGFTPQKQWRRQLTAMLEDLDQHLQVDGRIVLVGIPNLGRFEVLPQPLRTVLGWRARALDDDLHRHAAVRTNTIHALLPVPGVPATLAEDRFHPDAAAYRDLAAHLLGFLDVPQRTISERSG